MYPGISTFPPTPLPTFFKIPVPLPGNCPPENSPTDPVGSQEVTHQSSWLPTGFHLRNSQVAPKLVKEFPTSGPRGPPVPGGGGRRAEAGKFRGGFGASFDENIVEGRVTGELWGHRPQGLGVTRSSPWGWGGIGKVVIRNFESYGKGCGGKTV